MDTVLIQEEMFDAVWPDIQDLLVLHYQEIAQDQDKIPLDVDIEKYRELERLGILWILTARLDGVLCGYIVMLIHPPLHYASTLCAVTDVYYIDPSLRRLGYGLQLFQEMEKSMQARGVKKLFSHMKLYAAHPELYDLLEWIPTETIYSKWIGG